MENSSKNEESEVVNVEDMNSLDQTIQM